MENASKALIIAGAILLAILLISLGIMIFAQAQDTVNNSGMNEAATTSFNNKFLKYEGTRKGSEVKALVNEAIAANADDNNSNNNISVEITFGGEDLTKKGSSDILTTKTYEVNLKTYEKGRIKTIEVKEKTTPSLPV